MFSFLNGEHVNLCFYVCKCLIFFLLQHGCLICFVFFFVCLCRLFYSFVLILFTMVSLCFIVELFSFQFCPTFTFTFQGSLIRHYTKVVVSDKIGNKAKNALWNDFFHVILDRDSSPVVSTSLCRSVGELNHKEWLSHHWMMDDWLWVASLSKRWNSGELCCSLLLIVLILLETL